MLCQRCLKKPASYHSPQIVNNEVVQIHLCEDCVNRKNEQEAQNGFDDKLNYVYEGLLRSKDEKTSTEETRCERCGTGLKEFKKTHLLGCPDCYGALEKYFAKDLDSTNVVYARETHASEQTQNLVHLKSELKRAVEEENFERAADLRDVIQNLEQRGAARDH
jgi:protein arginine kinase activator